MYQPFIFTLTLNITRTGETATGTDVHGPGMSYCFGCKQDIATFNSTVAPDCEPEGRTTILAREGTGDADGDGVDDPIYRGNVKNVDESCKVVATGGLRWAGLIDDEHAVWIAAGGKPNHPFNPTNYWSGIDCSGFVQRSVDGSRDIVTDLSITIPRASSSQKAKVFFTTPSQVFYQAKVGDGTPHKKQLTKLRKGDLVKYGTGGHISIIYSDKPDENGKYQVIHAYGSHLWDHDSDDETAKVFSRKVIITTNKISSKETGYGRIRLW